MALKDWQDTEVASLLELPINGKTYRIPALGHLDEIAIREEQARIRDGGGASQMSDDEFMRLVLGPVLDEMRADNVPDRAIVHAVTVAHTDAVAGRAAAEALWEHGPDPEALAAARAAYANMTISPATQPPAPTSSTKRPGSTAPTKRPRKPRSSGTTSSPSTV